MCKSLYYNIAATLLLLLSAGCANIGNPSGGARDEDPPRFLSANPHPGAINVSRNKITLNFNELVNVRDAFQNVVVSPVTGSTPKVSTSGRRITIDFDSLKPTTTYTVDFGNSIEDNTENNKLPYFAYTFSTGPDIDTLRIAGRVLGARNLEPEQGITVGVTRNLSDSAFKTLPLLRVARTDDRGRFVIRGLAPGHYRVFALADRDNDFKYSNPEENIAFYPVSVSPTTENAIAFDSIWNVKTGKLDTILPRHRSRFLPDNLLLRSFTSDFKPQYLSKYERPDSTRILLRFNAPLQQIPSLRLPGADDEFPGVVEASQKLDSIVVWLSPQIARIDSLSLVLDFPRVEQDGASVDVSDTLNFFLRRLPAPKKKPAKSKIISASDSLKRITFDWKITAQREQDIHRPLTFESPVPLAYLDTTAIHLESAADSIYTPVTIPPIIYQRDSLSPRHFIMEYPWEAGAKYRLSIDSIAAMDMYGRISMPAKHDFSVKKAEEYCSLTFRITGQDTIPAFVELLNSSDSPVRIAAVEKGTAYFPFLSPGRYFARIILDYNGNGTYDTGDYDLLRQPEPAYYYPKAINIKKNWDKEESWDIFATPVDMQKPTAILKNRPDSGKHRSKSDSTEEDDDDEIFDPTRNPFDPNDRGARRSTAGSY